MTLSPSYHVGDYNVETALRLMGPADFGAFEPHGSLEQVILIVKQIALCVLRILNYVCGDHQWYDNQTAQEIVEQYFRDPNSVQENEALHQRVEQLYNALGFRANGNVSYVEGVNRGLLPSTTQREEQLPILPVVEVAAQEEDPAFVDNPSRECPLNLVDSQSIFEGLPPEMQSEILKKLDETSLLHLMLTNSTSYNSLKNDPVLYKNLLIQLALKKMIKNASRIENIQEKENNLVNIIKVLALINPEQAFVMANLIQHKCDKVYSLYKITKIQAGRDPQIVNERILQELISINPMPDSVMKEVLFTYIVRTQALVNPELALATASQHSPMVIYIALLEIVKRQALTNPEQALSTAREIQDEGTRALAIYKIAKTQAFTNPEHALRTAREIQNQDVFAKAIHKIAQAQAFTSPEQANQFLQQALEILPLFQNESATAQALCEIAKTQTATNPEQAHQLLQQALDLANLLQDPIKKAKVFCEILKAQAFTNPEQTNQLLQQADATINSFPINSFRSQATKAWALSMANAQAATNPEHANQLFQLTQLSVCLLMDEHETSNAIRQIAKTTIESICDMAKKEALTNPKRGNEFFQQALTLASLHDHPVSLQTELLGKIASKMFKTR